MVVAHKEADISIYDDISLYGSAYGGGYMPIWCIRWRILAYMVAHKLADISLYGSA